MRKLGIVLAIPIIIGILPTPSGLTYFAWLLFGFYLAAIVGLVLKPYSEPVILLAAVAASAVTAGIFKHFEGQTVIGVKDVLSGYASGTTWLVFAAFTLSSAFVVTGLGKRLAYHLIGLLGNTTLRLGYVTAFLDLLIAPATPSNTARAGGIVFPIINSVANALGSDPATSPRKAGHYLMLNIYMNTKVTSYMFLTAMAPNALALSILHDVLDINLSWGGWALAASLPGLLCLLLTPWVIYKLYPPELRTVDNQTIAKQGLKELGPIKTTEKMLIVVFLLALLGWIFGDTLLGIDAASIALFIMALVLVINIITWQDIQQNKGGWNTLIWYGGIIGLSGVLKKVGFFEWLAQALQQLLDFDADPYIVLVVILLMSVAIRYLFASGGAYVAAMVLVFATVGKVAGAPPMLLALGLLFSNSYGGSLTHYGGAAAPIVFGAGYNDTQSWWLTGAVLGFGQLLIHCTLGIMWWQLLLSNGLI